MGQIEIDLIKIRENGIFLMVPAYGGQCFAAFARSLAQLSALCTYHQIPLDTFFIYNESLVTRARNYCADEFLRRKFRRVDENGNMAEHYFQHGIFIDTDIEFNPTDVLVLAHLQNSDPAYDVICGPYPKKVIDYAKMKYAVDKGLADENPEHLERYIGDYVFNLPPASAGIYADRPGEVLESGTGFMMFRRDTVLKVIENNPQLAYMPDHNRSENFDGSRDVYAIFDTVIDPDTRRYLSEDYYFCKLVRQAGMKIWIVPYLELKHHGYFIYGGSLPAMAAAGLSATVDPNLQKKNNNRDRKRRK